MIKLFVIIGIIVIAVVGFGYIQDTQSSMTIQLWDYDITFSLSFAVFMQLVIIVMSLCIFKLMTSIVALPRWVSSYFFDRKTKKGYMILSTAFFALEAGDVKNAEKNIAKINKYLPQESMAVMLKCKLAIMKGQSDDFKKYLNILLKNENTRGYALRYLYQFAEQETHADAMLYFAQQAQSDKLTLEWSGQAIVDSYIALKDYNSAIAFLHNRRKLWKRSQSDRQLAILYLAEIETLSPYRASRAFELAKKAYACYADFVPCVSAYAKALIAMGNSKKAMKILEKQWRQQPHPDIAYWYAWADLHDGPYQRMQRLEKLAKKYGKHIDIDYALCLEAMTSMRYEQARDMLRPLIDEHNTKRLYLLMAEIEDKDRYGSIEKARWYYQKALQAPLDCAWVEDDYVSDVWMAISPVDGKINRFVWKKPQQAKRVAIHHRQAEDRNNELSVEEEEQTYTYEDTNNCERDDHEKGHKKETHLQKDDPVILKEPQYHEYDAVDTTQSHRNMSFNSTEKEVKKNTKPLDASSEFLDDIKIIKNKTDIKTKKLSVKKYNEHHKVSRKVSGQALKEAQEQFLKGAVPDDPGTVKK